MGVGILHHEGKDILSRPLEKKAGAYRLGQPQNFIFDLLALIYITARYSETACGIFLKMGVGILYHERKKIITRPLEKKLGLID
jgi:hypothetical protein